MQHCEKCNHDTTLIQSVRESAMAGYVDYYRCPVCGEVWGAPKEGDEPDPPEQDRHQSANDARNSFGQVRSVRNRRAN